MRASVLVFMLTEAIERDGDLPVMLSGLDGWGWDDLRRMETIPVVPVESPVCMYEEAESIEDHFHAFVLT